MGDHAIMRVRGVRGGAPVLGDSLVSVQEVLSELWLGATPAQAARSLPGIDAGDVRRALQYALAQLEAQAEAEYEGGFIRLRRRSR